MAKKLASGGLISPTNLWAKPMPPMRHQPKAASETETKGTRKMAREDDDVMEDEEIDVDAELAEADTEENLDEVEVDTEDAVEEVTAEFDEDDPDEEEESDSDEEPDYDGEDGDVADEGQDVTEDDEEVVTAVADDENTGDDDSVSISSEVSANMAEKMSLSDHVRAEITRRQKAGESPIRGKDIVEALAKKKINVSPAQVSQLLKKAGLSAGRKGRPKATTTPEPTEKSRVAMKAKKKPEATTKAAPAPAPRQALKARPATASGNGFKVPMSQLQAAEAFVEACGGSFQSAERILTAAAQLSQTFSG